MNLGFYNTVIYIETIEAMAKRGYVFEINDGKIKGVQEPKKKGVR